ncbi:helix-turn-helix domain-containing protein [Streptomyces lomondensis]|uniref:HTH araC/xylS-type domain-containing protein n=1 Tax=Streptomyces lomondensis TaxID=68229 RepID=A0ABQ2XT61_9ACTN|nr:helix-turn-helix domain-containing protein [Streptomyces lomondensis]MCF0082717.1 helix-turn-helix domain-containing protein [Streptomyces lomondensis]GGX32198.1 hypothetical protein GCM10010383_73110 [Streptomyces lomondensis]
MSVVSTASVPAEDRLAYWYEVIGQTYEQLASVRLDLSKLTNAPYTGMITAGRIGPLTVASTVADPLHVRKPRRGELTDDDCLNVCIQDHGHLVIDQNNGQTLLRPGSLTLFDTTRPYTVTYPDPFRTHVIQIPRAMLGFRAADLHRLTAVPIEADTETAALVTPFLTRLATQMNSHSPHIGELLAHNAADLLATLLAERLDRDLPDTGTDAARTLLRLRIQAFIDRHLGDPHLSPRTIAEAHHVSLRHVHRLFREQGTTVSRWIQHRRLEACRRELSRPHRADVSVTAVAHRFGFTSRTHFSRAFRAAYGLSPREWRAIARHRKHA